MSSRAIGARAFGGLAVVAGIWLAAGHAQAASFTQTIAVDPGAVQIVDEPGRKRATFRVQGLSISLVHGNFVDVTFTLPSPMTVRDLPGGDNSERVFFGTLNDFVTGTGFGTSFSAQLTFSGVSGSLLVNPITGSQVFDGNLTNGAFSFTELRAQESVMNPSHPSQELLHAFGVGFEFTADDIELPGAPRCGDDVENTSAEQCDEGSANGTPGTCCLAGCTLRPAGQLCRPRASLCDVPDSCNGTDGSCPVDDHEPDGTACDDGQLCTGADACVNGACGRHANLSRGTPCMTAGRAGACDGSGACVAGACGNGVVEPGEDCDGGECCDPTVCRFFGSGHQCGRETRTCHEQRECTGTASDCPTEPRLSPEGSTCSDGDDCTDVDTCQQGGCVPGQRICGAEATARRNGTRRVRIRVQCLLDADDATCDAAGVVQGGAAAAETVPRARGGATCPTLPPGPVTIADRKAAHGKSRRIKDGSSALRFKRTVVLRLNGLGRQLLACQDVSVAPLVTVHRRGKDLDTLGSLLRLLRFRAGR